MHDRDLNDSNVDYNYVSMHENDGLRFYLHKYFVGYNSYYMQIKNEERISKIEERM